MPKIAAIQMTSTPDVAKNLEIAGFFIQDAAKNQAQVVVLPEMFAIVGSTLADKLQVKENYGSGIIQDFLHEQAKKHKIWIIAGTIPISSSCDNKVQAACLVYDDQGQVRARYNKIHLFDARLGEEEVYCESESTEAGDSIAVVDTPCGKIGVAVCYDIRFPELFRKLSASGAQIMALPAAFHVKTGEAHWEILLRARAIENFCYVVAAGQAGLHLSGRTSYGHSLIVEPWGSIVAQKFELLPGVIYAEVDLDHLQSIRKNMPVLQHRKLP